jgi:biotin transport system substrate-specific component
MGNNRDTNCARHLLQSTAGAALLCTLIRVPITSPARPPQPTPQRNTQYAPSPSMPPTRRLIQTTILPAIIGAVAITLAAQIAIPIDPVPITLHTVAVLLVAWIAGPTVGALAALLYLMLALCGLPVLTGWARSPFGTFLNTNSAGYVVAFIPAAFVFGKLIARTPSTAFLRVLLLAILGHAIILAIGFVWLASRIGFADATSGGLIKLLPGAAIKSVLVAATIYAWHHLRNLGQTSKKQPRNPRR